MKEHDGEGTDTLIRNLAAQSGSGVSSSLALGYALGLGMAMSLAAALLVVVVVPGIRPGLLGVMAQGVFRFKLAATGLLVLGGICLVRAAGTPGQAMRPWRALAPAAVLMLASFVVDDSGRSMLGGRTLSAPICVGAIVLASLPGIAFLLLSLRRGIPTHLASAGAAAGLLSGAIGAMAYTLACVNDGVTFVAVWYLAAIAITTGIGAAVGRRALAW